MMRKLAAGLALVALALTGGCSSAAVPGATATPGATTSRDCRLSEDVKSCGGLDSLIREARQERELILPGNPHQNPSLAALAGAFSRKYKLKVTWAFGSVSTQEQLDLAVDGELQPDIFFIDPTAAPLPEGRASAYRVINFEMVAPTHRDNRGFWIQDFGAVMTVGYDSAKLGKIDSLDALASDESVQLAVAGDPKNSADAVQSILMLGAAGQSVPQAGAGLEYLQGLASKGRLASQYASLDGIKAGTQNVVLGWNNQQQRYQALLKGADVKWEWFVPSGTPVTAYHGLAINAEAAHPAAARLWEEYTFSAEAQRSLLKAGAMPSLYGYLLSSGGIDQDGFDSLPLLEAKPWTATSQDVAEVRTKAAAAWKRLYVDG